jgi:uncharacterized membrane protein (DUF106 family)
MDVVAQVVVWLNTVANALGKWLLAPISMLPGWLSATLVSALTGLFLLGVFKYTSNQKAIKRVRDDINANLLALKLYKESAAVAIRAQGRLLIGAARLLVLGLVPTLVMMVPVSLFLAQLALWYQSRPLRVGEDAVMIVKLNGTEESAWPAVQLEPNEALEVTTGPVRVQSKRWICWNIKARKSGYQRMVFQVDGQAIDKELAIGDGYMRVSTQRPGWSCWDALENPEESPFRPDSPIQSIEIDYPDRCTWKILGVEPWIVFWFAVSLVVGFCFRRVLKVNI